MNIVKLKAIGLLIVTLACMVIWLAYYVVTVSLGLLAVIVEYVAAGLSPAADNLLLYRLRFRDAMLAVIDTQIKRLKGEPHADTHR